MEELGPFKESSEIPEGDTIRNNEDLELIDLDVGLGQRQGVTRDGHIRVEGRQLSKTGLSSIPPNVRLLQGELGT